MSRRPAFSQLVVAAAWLAAIASLLPVGKALRGDFRIKTPSVTAKGILTPVSLKAPQIRLDTATLVVLVYSATCPACKANTDNWLRFRADLQERYPGLAVVVIPAPQDSIVRPELPAALGKAFPEYRLDSAMVRDLAIDAVPATVLVERGRVVWIANGILGPRRRERFAAGVAPAGR